MLAALVTASLAAEDICRPPEQGARQLNFEDAVVSVNNLGGLGCVADEGAASCFGGGPNNRSDPHVMRFDSVGVAEGIGNINLLVVNETGYANSKSRNGIYSTDGVPNTFAQINLNANTAVQLRFIFVDNASQPVVLQRFWFSVLDIDTSECVAIAYEDWHAWEVSDRKVEKVLLDGGPNTTEVTTTKELDASELAYRDDTEDNVGTEQRVSEFCATVQGTGADNPARHDTLTDAQKLRVVEFEFRDKADFTLYFSTMLNNGAVRRFRAQTLGSLTARSSVRLVRCFSRPRLRTTASVLTPSLTIHLLLTRFGRVSTGAGRRP